MAKKNKRKTKKYKPQKTKKTEQIQENEKLGKITCNFYHKGLISLTYKRFLESIRNPTISGMLVNVKKLAGGEGSCWFVVFCNFPGINVPTMVNFRLLICQPAYKTPENIQLALMNWFKPVPTHHCHNPIKNGQRLRMDS